MDLDRRTVSHDSGVTASRSRVGVLTGVGADRRAGGEPITFDEHVVQGDLQIGEGGAEL